MYIFSFTFYWRGICAICCNAALSSIVVIFVSYWNPFSEVFTREAWVFSNALNLTSGVFALGYLGVGLVEGRLVPIVEKVKISLNGLKGKITAVQISDLHIGGLIEENVVAAVVKQVNALKPDFIVLTGDIIDAEVSRVPKAIDALAKLQAPLGVYFILGNHEYFHGIASLLEVLKDKGIIVLENACVLLEKGEAKLNLAGVYDLFGRRINALEPDLEQALQKGFQLIR